MADEIAAVTPTPDEVAAMTPAEATARLAAMQAAMNPPPPPTTKPADAQDARARLDVLSRDAGFAEKLFGGDVATRKMFDDLVAAADAGDTAADALANIVEEPALMEFTTGNQLPRRAVAATVASMREAGLSDGSIEQALNGGTVTAAEMAAAKAFQAMRHGDAEWRGRLLSGDWSARREHELLSIILSSDVA